MKKATSSGQLSFPSSEDTIRHGHFSHGFFDEDPAVKKGRSIYFSNIPKSLLMVLVVIIWAIFPIYWGSMFKAIDHVHNLNGIIVDLDGGEIGKAVTQAFLNATGPSTSMTWSLTSPEDALSRDSDFEHAVVDEKAWMVVTINANASNSLSSAIASADASYTSSHAVTIWTNEARNQNAYRVIYPPVITIMQQLEQQFAAEKATQLSSSNDLSKLLSVAPSTLTNPLSYTTVNTRPFNVTIVTVVNYIGMIYLTVIVFIMTLISYNTIMMATGLYPKLKFSHLLALRLGFPFVGYFVLSTFYALLSLAFGAPFTRWFGGSGFVIYWMMTWCAMLALGLAIEAMVTILTARFIPFFLVLWIIVNVSCAFYPIDMLPGVFKYGYASPFYNYSRVVLTVCFNTKNEMGLNFGVQIVWIAINVTTLSVFQWFVCRRDRKAWDMQGMPGAEVERFSAKKYKLCTASAPAKNGEENLNRPVSRSVLACSLYRSEALPALSDSVKNLNIHSTHASATEYSR